MASADHLQPGMRVIQKSRPLSGTGVLARESGRGWFIRPDPSPYRAVPREIWAAWDDIIIEPGQR